MKTALRIGAVLLVLWLAWRFLFGQAAQPAPVSRLVLTGLDPRQIASTAASSPAAATPAGKRMCPPDPYGIFKCAPVG